MERAMKTKTVLKMLIDLSMFVLYLQLTFSYDVNTLYHEVAGIAVGLLFITHVVLNFKSVKGKSRRLQQGKLSVSSKILFIDNLFLFPIMAVTITTGLLEARDLYTGLSVDWLGQVHDIVAYIGLGLLSVHLLLHVRYLFGVSQKLIRSKGFQMVGGVISAIAIVGVLLWGELLSVGSGSIVVPDTLTAGLTEESTTIRTSHHHGHEAIGSNESTSSSGDDSGAISAGNSSATSDGSSNSVTVCTACGHHCPISSLRCDKGVEWAESAGYI